MWRVGTRIALTRRWLSSSAVPQQTEAEARVAQKLKTAFSKATVVEAHDISGGCGTMFQVRVEAPDFAGKLKIQQHKMVTEVLKDDIPQWHGITIETKAA